jgi:dTDP-4-dehydrorhamnose reductase
MSVATWNSPLKDGLDYNQISAILKKIVVTGFAGMLGQALVAEYQETSDWKVIGCGRNPADLDCEQVIGDLTDPSFRKHLLNSVKPDVVIHAAAIVNVAKCEDNPLVARGLHVDAARDFAMAVPRTVYVSSDALFSRGEAPFSESDIPDPINGYARTKYLGERAVLAANPEGLVLRSNLFGIRSGSPGPSLAEWALGELKQGHTIKGYDNVFFNPLDVFSLAAIIRTLEENGTSGLLHVGCTDFISKYRFLVLLARTFGIPEKRIERTVVQTFDDGVIRSLNTVLDIRKASEVLDFPSIQDCLESLKNKSIRLEHD